MNRRETPPPRLILFSPPGEADVSAALIAEACEVADVVSVILRTASHKDDEIVARAKKILSVAIEDGAALLLQDRADLVSKAQVDGAHFSNFPEQSPQLAALKPRFVAGAAGLVSRHDAMIAGEAGADYVMFGEAVGEKRPSSDAIVERLTWWSEIFEVPCVAFAGALEEIPAFVRAGADFVALDETFWKANDPIAEIKQAQHLLRSEHT
jgi:thiamine-phosphate pyrophosphorylase